MLNRRGEGRKEIFTKGNTTFKALTFPWQPGLTDDAIAKAAGYANM